MSGFNFGAGQSFENTSKKRLAGGDIHKVILKEAKFDEMKGKKDPTQTYQTLVVTFENEDGYYTERLFNPGEKGDERRSNEWNGQTLYSASANESLGMFIGQILTVVNKESLAKLNGVTLSNNFEKVAKYTAKILEASVGMELELKLMLGKDGSPRLPILASINREGQVYPNSNFIAKEGLFFSDKELASITKIKSAAPTDVAAIVAKKESSQAKVEDHDLDLDL